LGRDQPQHDPRRRGVPIARRHPLTSRFPDTLADTLKEKTMTTARSSASGAAPAGKPAIRPVMTNGYEIDADFVIYRLEEAGATLLALPGTGWSTRLRSSALEIVRTALESYGWSEARIRPMVPSADKITRMDEAMSWIPLIPLDRYVLRRVVGARSLVHPVTDRHLFPWRRLGKALGADHKAIQRWHAQGIAIIVQALRAAA
jgi:hypothetical protein